MNELQEKYASLQEADSPLKGVNDMKKILIRNDEKLNEIKSENMELKTEMIKLKAENADLVHEMKKTTDKYTILLKEYNEIREQNIGLPVHQEIDIKLKDVHEKYETLKKCEGPNPDVNNLKKLLGQYENKIEDLLKENESFKEQSQSNYNTQRETSIENLELKNKLHEINLRFNGIYRKNEEANQLLKEKDPLKINESLIKKVEELENQHISYSNQNKEIIDLKKKLQEYETTINYLSQNIREVTERYDVLKSLHQNNPDLKPIIDSINKIENENKTLQDNLFSRNQEILSLNFLKDITEKLKCENLQFLEEINQKNFEIDDLKAKEYEYPLLRPQPIQTKLNKEEEYKKFITELKSTIANLEIENNSLKNSLDEIKDKYESLRDIDSPIKEVSQMKKIIKKTDENLDALKKENQTLILKLQNQENITKETIHEYEKKYKLDITGESKDNIIIELNSKVHQLEKDIANLRKTLEITQEKYESLRDIDSPIKEVSQMKKLLKSNDSNMQILQKENIDLIAANDKLHQKIKENEASLVYEKIDFIKENEKTIDAFKLKINLLENENLKLNANIFTLQEKYESLRDIDSPVKEVSTMKKLLKSTD